MFNPQRLIVARQRRHLSAKELAARIGRVPLTITRLEQGTSEPEPETMAALSEALSFPEHFFYGEECERLTDGASFRSLTSMRAHERDAALAAGSLAFIFCDWIGQRFNRPSCELPLLDPATKPDQAARMVRQEWALGEAPISDMMKMLEAKGVRVFSLAETTQTVDAFSCWRGDTPYIFLNLHKSAERTRFDAAHELGHLVLHRHGGGVGRAAEMEANSFASAFLMPEADVLARIQSITSLAQIVKLKRRWRVSTAALAYRLNRLRRVSDWQYRGLCIEMQQKGYTKQEPDPIEREKSVLWQKIFSQLWAERCSREHIAADLGLPVVEIDNLVFGLTGAGEREQSGVDPSKPRLVAVS
ncbi:ImmA/IrrE family metallo-endopeptidase [Sphingomonas sp. PAMC26645]|uniref:ImmA/IrrE family metallo-endopeptidase n=1 Tax=Sphingomonas sp. PAMC26645 TaxID=2565555 RepID=UPI00109E2552|nr:ImmA/IrrE family metallo-endopeptidase [Sphingomonas sp. PAMC26645]QCB44299.1 ImmA/IrrE family metallo-endopeptidase [Sphingomonas sp. PAMC26645]